jgi:hypothetical protein
MSPQAGFLLQDQIIPRLQSAIPNVVHCVGSEDHEELIQDSIAMAAKMMDGAEQAGKKVVRSASGSQGKEVSAGNITFYTIEKLRSGRRSTGSSCVDVFGSGTQLNGTTRLNSLEEVVASSEEGGEIFTFNDVLSRDEEDPGTKAARKMDWEDFVSGLSARDQAIIQFMIEGTKSSELARKLKVTDSTIETSKRRLRIKIIEFMGPEILIDIQRRPQWKQNLEATKEKMACKHERCH